MHTRENIPVDWSRSRQPRVPVLHNLGSRRGIYIDYGIEGMLDFHNNIASVGHVHLHLVHWIAFRYPHRRRTLQENRCESPIHAGPSEQGFVRRWRHPPSLLHQVRPIFHEIQTDGDRKPVPHLNFLGALLPHCSNVDLHKFGEQCNWMDPDGEDCDHFSGPHVCKEPMRYNNIRDP